jgi:hypothetical protein
MMSMNSGPVGVCRATEGRAHDPWRRHPVNFLNSSAWCLLGGMQEPALAFNFPCSALTAERLDGNNMDPVKVAARFVAFACYLNGDTKNPPSPEEAGTYARGDWKRFLPYVHEDLGSFLTGPPRSLNAVKGDRPAQRRATRRSSARPRYCAGHG